LPRDVEPKASEADLRHAPPLAQVRVAERATGLAAAYAGFLLHELGAEVVRSGARPRHPVLDRGKADGAPAAADVSLADEDAPGPSATVSCRVRAWGARGPRAALPPDHALLAAATGLAATQWSWSGRPVWLVTPMIDYMTGILAALGTVAALFAWRRGAPGQAVEVTGLAGALALASGTYVTGPNHEGTLLAGGEPRGLYPTYGLYRAADGWLLVGALTQAFWVKLMTVLGRVDLLAHPRLQANPLTFGHPELRALVRGELEPIFAARPVREWEVVLRAADIPCGVVATRAQALEDPGARALGLVVRVDDPALGLTWQPAGPAAFSATPLAAPGTEPVHWRAPAPATAATPPRTCLAGIRVLDVTSFIAGPFCPMLLADLGADVIKVEGPEGDPFRMTAFGFVGWNRGKRSIVLDLRRPAGRTAFLDLARTADVVVDNLRAGALERLGVGWEALSAANPRLVHTSITGFGLAGPLAALPGFDPVLQARCGLMAAQGGTDEPVFHTVPYNDYCAGALAALATIAALLVRERTGRGQRVDVSLFRTALVAQAAAVLGTPAEAGGRDYLGPAAARRLYRCADGWLCVAAGTAAEAAALGRLAGVGLGGAEGAESAAAAAVARWLGDRTRAQALAHLAAAGVPAAPCLDVAEVFADPHLAANGGFVTLADPVLGPVTLGGPLIGFSATPIAYRGSAPPLGAHGAEVLRGIGYPPERVAAALGRE